MFDFETLLTLAVIGLCIYLVDTYVKMWAPVKTVFRALAVLGLILWLLHAFGIVDVPKFWN